MKPSLIMYEWLSAVDEIEEGEREREGENGMCEA